MSFKIERGEMLGLLGPNGAGKTTAIRISAVRASHGSAAPPYLARGLLPMGDGPVMGVCQDVGGGSLRGFAFEHVQQRSGLSHLSKRLVDSW